MAGVTRAANKLHLTQSAVSMQLKRLEDLVGMPLLVRDTSGMRATTEGEQLLSYAKRLVELNDEALGRLLQRNDCLLYTSPSPRDGLLSRMPSSA